MKLYANLIHAASFLSVATLMGCGNNGPSTKNKPVTDSGSYARSITADSSMRSVVNKRWSCTDEAQGTSFALVNGPQTQSFQLNVTTPVGETSHIQYLVANDLDCYYSSSDSRIIKCFSKADPTLKVVSSVIQIEGKKLDVVTLSVEGANKSFVVFDSTANRFMSLAEFQKTFPNPIALQLNSANEKCGFED